MVKYVLQRVSDGLYLDGFTVDMGKQSRRYSFCFSLEYAFHFKNREDAELYRSLMHVLVPDFTLYVVPVQLIKPVVKEV